jgi:hypothetical protein
VAQVVGGLLFGLRRDRRERRVARGERAPERRHEGRVEELPCDGDGEIAVRLLDEEQLRYSPASRR